MVRAIIFDLYGVLGLNGWQDFKQLHFGDDPEQWERLRKLGQAVDAREASYEQLVEEISRASGAGVREVRQNLESTKPNVHLLDFIENSLHDYRIGVLSNANADVMRGIFTDDNLKLFDDVVLSVDTGLTKPDETMFELACQRLGVEPKECLFVDDKQSNVDAANRVGLKGLLYRSVTQTERAIKDELSK